MLRRFGRVDLDALKRTVSGSDSFERFPIRMTHALMPEFNGKNVNGGVKRRADHRIRGIKGEGKEGTILDAVNAELSFTDGYVIISECDDELCVSETRGGKEPAIESLHVKNVFEVQLVVVAGVS